MAGTSPAVTNFRIKSHPNCSSRKCEGRPSARRAVLQDCRLRNKSSGEGRLWRLGRLWLLRPLARRTVAALGHELIEFRPILGKAKPLQELLEFALLIFEPA